MKKNIVSSFILMVLSISFVLPFISYAQITASNTDNSSSNITIHNPLSCGDNCTLITFINLVLTNVVMPLAAVLAILYIIWAGFTYVTAQGNPGEIAKAHQRLLWALIGTGILLGAAGISQVIQTTVNNLIK